MKSFDKLKTKLAELFQLDQADLDFGIYRIMNARRDEITRFLENDLLPQVQEAFKEYKSADKTEIQKELDQVIAGVKAAGMAPEQSPKVKELRARLATDAVDVTGLENEVFDHLYSFFSRYYDEGDFISLRRYKEGVYAIPYEGEEVKLYWANHDQYYIKTTEYFRDYAFKSPDDSRVHFKIIEADTEKDNVKAANGKDRRFFLHGDKPVAEENGELIIRFEYLSDGEKQKQDQINAETVRRILENLQTASLAGWQRRLNVKWKRSDGTVSDKTILEKHIHDYTRRNTFDYFIHKDLGGFLRRELDFYIKNEVMRLDDVENEPALRVEQYLSKIKVIRKIAHKLIDFLAQIEDFQKKLWLKKKFVIETQYCVTIDRILAIPDKKVREELLREIAANDEQREEWVRLYTIDEIKRDLTGAVDYSRPLTTSFLKANAYMVLDTALFPSDFRNCIDSLISDLDEQMDGTVIHAENFQGLELLACRSTERIDCIYIDPPYNTDASPILYKNDYKDSSWLSLLQDRLFLGRHLLANSGLLCVAIDDIEFPRLRLLTERVFASGRIVGVVAVRSNPAGRSTANDVSVAHEYALLASPSRDTVIGRLDRSEKQKARYGERDEIGAFEWVNFRKHGGGAADRSARPRMFYPIYVSSEGIRIPQMEWDDRRQEWTAKEGPRTGEAVVLPINAKGQEKRWKWGHPSMSTNLKDFCAKPDQTGKPGVYMKSRVNPLGMLPLTWWEKKQYSATEYGTNLLNDILGDGHGFSFPKSVHLVEDSLRVCNTGAEGTVLDFFAGSGTTAHAVINLNREDGGNRRYILVEMAEYFDTVLLPRIKKVVYAKDWKDGKPVSRNTGISHMFKYIRLESYEDALANIELKRTPAQQDLLDRSPSFRESYMLKYMLDAEAKGSWSLLNIDQFEDPFNYQLLVGAGSVGETKPVTVDLVETFNWLLGLRVRHMDVISGFHIVEGTNPKGEKVLVIWRKVRDLSETDPKKIASAREKTNRDLEAFFQKQQYNTLDSEFDIIYVNGDNNLMNVPLAPQGGEPRYKVRLIEEEFKRLMFDVEDV